MIPQLVVSGVIRLIEKHINVDIPIHTKWIPALFFVVVAAFGSFIITIAFNMADKGESGSEFMPLILLGMGMYCFWIAPVITIVISVIKIKKAKQRP